MYASRVRRDFLFCEIVRQPFRVPQMPAVELDFHIAVRPCLFYFFELWFPKRRQENVTVWPTASRQILEHGYISRRHSRLLVDCADPALEFLEFLLDCFRVRNLPERTSEVPVPRLEVIHKETG